MNTPEHLPKPRFELGHLFVTPGAQDTLNRLHLNFAPYVRRHGTGDWGDMCEEDKDANDRAVVDGSRLFSDYQLSEEDRLWLITEAKNNKGSRESTCVLLPQDY